MKTVLKLKAAAFTRHKKIGCQEYTLENISSIQFQTNRLTTVYFTDYWVRLWKTEAI